MKFSEFVDISELRELCKSFFDLTGAVTAILDLEGNILVATGWQDICSRFHRVNPQPAHRCTESDTVLAGQLKKCEAYNVYQCKNGLVDVAVPIIVGGEHVANFFTGQFFFHPPDEKAFIAQAEEFGFDKKAYLEALHNVPVFSEQQVRVMMEFFLCLARIVGEMGLAGKRREESNRELRTYQEHLEELVKQRTNEIAASEKKYLDLYENSPDMYVTTDAKTGMIVQCNATLATVIGCAREEIVGQAIIDLFHPVCSDEIRRMFEPGGEQDDVHDREFILRRRDGSLLDVSLNVSAAPDENSSLRYRHATMRDISERKRIEDSLRFIAQRGWISRAGDFLTALATYLGTSFGVDYVIIDRLAADEPGVAETVALYAKGTLLPSMRYPLSNTPCENVMGKVLCYYPRGVQALFPADLLLAEMGVESYAGVPLWDSEGNALGLIAVMDSKPFCEGTSLTNILQLVATSAAAALEREFAEKELRTLNEQLEQRVRERTAELAVKNAELEKMNKIFVGRELRMMELKERIRELEEKAT